MKHINAAREAAGMGPALVASHKVTAYHVVCSCGMTVQSANGWAPLSANEFTLWLTRFLCEHEALAEGHPIVSGVLVRPKP